jgi:hypothetical protein
LLGFLRFREAGAFGFFFVVADFASVTGTPQTAQFMCKALNMQNQCGIAIHQNTKHTQTTTNCYSIPGCCNYWY